MTPERLAQIELAARYRAGSYDEIRYGALELLNEVERLRAGIEALADRLDPLVRIWQEEGEIELSVPMKSQVASLRALLNPPTEGEK